VTGGAGSGAPSGANSRTGSRENLCEECVQNPLDLVDASIQVDLSDEEAEEQEEDLGSGVVGPANRKKEGAAGGGGGDEGGGTMGRNKSRGSELGVNKKGTPLYSR